MDKQEIFDTCALMFVIFVTIAFFCCACTFSVSMVDTHGKAEDVVDTEQTNDPEVSPTLSLPVGVP